ncbi:MAG TPA: ester cyclase [Verrucomicrobiae bacterium]|nr:ester cyclase [Verrucomicrobiae bacterium]
MHSPAASKQTVIRYVEAFNRRDYPALTAVLAPDATVQGVLGWGNPDQALPIWRELHAAFDLQLAIESLVAEGNFVAVRYTERGKFIGPFRGQAPTGNTFELVAMEWLELRDGRICRRWGARDHAAQARQLGLKLN